MKHTPCLCLLAMALACTAVGANPAGLPADGNETNPLLDQMSQGSLSAAPSGFEENKGQVRTTAGEPAPFVRYRLSQGNTGIFLLGTGIAYQFNRMHYPEGYAELEKDRMRDPEIEEQLDALRSQVRLETYRMDMVIEGADPDPRISAEGRSSDYTNYYTHDALDVHTYARVTYHDVYPGIDWVVYTTEKGIEHDFVVHPGADPARIQLRFKDHEELYIDEEGHLIHGNRLGRFTEEKPVSFQGGKEVATGFLLQGDRVTFDLGGYDPDSTLTIDPARIWGTYYGGTGNDEGTSCAVDPDGNVYVAGETFSIAGIAGGGYHNTYDGGPYSDAFLVKFDPAGNRLWGIYYGGTGADRGQSCAVGPGGNVYMAGKTASTSGIASGGYQNTYGGDTWDAFLVKFDPDGTRLWGTYYGGMGIDHGESCAVDINGNVYLAGDTQSASGIASGGHQNTYGGDLDAFLVKFDPAGSRLWGTYYGGGSPDLGESCAVDPDGNVYMAGYVESFSGIAIGGHQNTHGGGFWDAFLVKFDPAGTRLWGTYYGGTNDDRGQSCAVDPNGNVYLTGYTLSFSGIASGGHQNTKSGGPDAFLAKFDPDGTRLWGTYYGGADWDNGLSCTSDPAGNVYLAGFTYSTSGIAIGGHQNTYGDSRDAFLVKFDPAGTRLWGTYYGGAGEEGANSCAVDPDGNVYLAGSTESISDIASGGHQDTYGGLQDAFLVKFGDWDCPTLYANIGDACDDGNAATVNDMVTADCECSGESPDGIEDQIGRAGLSMGIYPSPTTGRFIVHVEGLPAACATVLITVVDAEGKLVREQEVALANGAVTHEMDLAGLASQGLYAVRVTADGLHLVRRLCVAW